MPVGTTSARTPPPVNSYRRAADHIHVLRPTTARFSGLVSTGASTRPRIARITGATRSRSAAVRFSA
jgi:hypothetical protein